MTLYEELKVEVDKGLSGDVAYIPFGLERLDKYVELARNTLYVVGGESGSGKSTLVTDVFVTKPIQYMINNPNSGLKLNIKFLSMERKQYMNSAKMTSRMIFEQTGYIIDIKKMLGRGSTMNDTEQSYFEATEEIWMDYEKYLYVKEGVTKCEELKELIHKWGKEYGEIITEVDKDGVKKQTYKPYHDKQIVEIIIDHLGIAGRNKEEMDAISEVIRKGRDFYGFSFVVIVQLNRDISSVNRAKANSKPKLSDIHGTSSISHDADNVFLMFDPFRHVNVEESGEEVKDACNYDLSMLMSNEQKYYRALYLVKNSFAPDGMGIGLGFMGVCGIYKSLPKASDMTEDDYLHVTSLMIFRPHQKKLF